ncbi:MAG: hypothetical protein KKF44_03785 [Nanoarchaeota archaeon]|nr:hypothetical protein [Nanoarchaeota archaeon]
MSKKSKKKKKKPNLKKEKYAKFKKEKPGTTDLSMPDLAEEEKKIAREDEIRLNKHLRFNKNPIRKPIIERKMFSKRDKVR